MTALAAYGVEELSQADAASVNGGDGDIARAAGFIIGFAAGAFYTFGKALYENGGLFGTLEE